MAYAEYLAGMAFNNASLGYVHAMAASARRLLRSPSWCLQRDITPQGTGIQAAVVPGKLKDVAEAMGIAVAGLSDKEGSDKAIDAIKKLSSDINIPSGIAELGAKEEDLPVLAQNALKDACGATNPRQATLEEIIQIFKNSMK
jgi:alcohol dehydrogenase